MRAKARAVWLGEVFCCLLKRMALNELTNGGPCILGSARQTNTNHEVADNGAAGAVLHAIAISAAMAISLSGICGKGAGGKGDS